MAEAMPAVPGLQTVAFALVWEGTAAGGVLWGVRRFVRRLSLALAALVAGGALAVVALPSAAPGAGAPTSASFTAADFDWQVTGDASADTVMIAAGGTVSFAYPSGSSAHNADFSGGSAPSSCVQDAGSDSGPVPPLPATPTAPGWSGSCRFDTPGTYSFHCDMHPFMRGTVDVVDPNAPPPPTTTTTPAGTTTQPPAGGGSGGGSQPGTGSSPAPASGSPPIRVHVAHSQRGGGPRGTVTAPSGARIAVTALASSRALARHRPRRARQVTVGSLTRRAASAGATSFALRLDAAARGALRRHGRLALRLRIVVTPVGGRPVRATATVVLRAPAR